MSLNREEALKVCIRYLETYRKYLEEMNKFFLYDGAKLSEDFYAFLLNLIYDLELVNLNEIRVNFPAIDLGDRKNRIAYQITTNLNQSKTDETIEKFEEYGLDSYYDELVILSVAKRSSRVRPSRTNGSYRIQLQDISEIIQDLEKLNTKILMDVSTFLECELESKTISEQRLIRKRFNKFLPYKISIESYNDTYLINDFFTSAPIKPIFHPKIRSLLSQMFMEIAENVFNKNEDYSGKLIVEMVVGHQNISFTHTGPSFNPRKLLNIEGSKGKGYKRMKEFATAFRGKCGMKYLTSEGQLEHTWLLNFGRYLWDLHPYPECVIEAHEYSRKDIYNTCEVVYLLPDRRMKSSSKITAFAISNLEKIPKDFRPGIALYTRDDRLINDLEADFPGIDIKILDET